MTQSSRTCQMVVSCIFNKQASSIIDAFFDFWNESEEKEMGDEKRDILYDETISDSMQESIAKAVEVLRREMNWCKDNRIIVRPKVSIWKGLLPTVAYIILLILAIIFMQDISAFIGIQEWIVRIGIIVVFGLVVIIMYKKALIWSIHVYQRYAPEKMRASCLFEPSCSNYMIQAVRKYGAIKGTIKGIGRLSRCHFPNGGVDEP